MFSPLLGNTSNGRNNDSQDLLFRPLMQQLNSYSYSDKMEQKEVDETRCSLCFNVSASRHFTCLCCAEQWICLSCISMISHDSALTQGAYWQCPFCGECSNWFSRDCRCVFS